jgi:hypothetical protein
VASTLEMSIAHPKCRLQYRMLALA